MFDVAPTEFLLVALIALVVIGPKDLPRVLRVVGQWVGKARKMANHMRSGFDEMMRESEIAEMERNWTEENTRIMREHPTSDNDPAHMPAKPDIIDEPVQDSLPLQDDGTAGPTTVKP